MDTARLIRQLEHGLEVLPSIFDGLTDDQARWRPAEDKWSMLEVLCHLCDEEREDFRQRIRLTLEDPTQAWPPIDPAGWVQARSYSTRDLRDMVEDFRKERRESLEWLRGLADPDWSRTYVHPQLGEIRAGDLFASWVTHDWFHVRQLGRLQVQYLSGSVAPYSTRYVEP